MTHRIIEVRADSKNTKVLDAISQKEKIIDSWKTCNNEERARYSFVVKTEDVQEITDAIETTLGYTNTMKTIVMPVEAMLPKEKQEEIPVNKKKKKTPNRISIEELHQNIEPNAELGTNYLLYVLFSTIVAAVGLIENSVTTLIGAMVIAPFLGPVVAFTFAIAIGDRTLQNKSIKTLLMGFGLCLAISIFVGMAWKFLPFTDSIQYSSALMERTNVNLYSGILAFASGAAAAICLTSGTSAVLVGVMVAVALLPPLTTLGITLGAQYYVYSIGSLVLVTINMVCIILSTQLVFLFKKIKPRTSDAKSRAKSDTIRNILICILLLIILGFIIYYLNINDLVYRGNLERLLFVL